MLFSSTNFFQWAISRVSTWRNSSGVLPTGLTATDSHNCIALGSFTARPSAALSLATMAGGVAPEPSMAIQPGCSKPGAPISATVLRPGSSAVRSAVRTAIAFTFPDRMMGNALASPLGED